MNNHDVLDDCKVCPGGTYFPAPTLDSIERVLTEFNEGGDDGVCSGLPLDDDGTCSQFIYLNTPLYERACVSCPIGTYNDDEGPSKASYDDLSDCEPCGEGFNSEPDRKSCYELDQRCEAGESCQFDAEGIVQLPRELCSTGRYSSQVQWSEGMTASPDCRICEAGYMYRGAQYKRQCHVGFFQDETGQRECKSCKAGTYQDRPGQARCNECGKGSFCLGGGVKLECEGERTLNHFLPSNIQN